MEKTKKTDLLRKINFVLVGLIILINGYLAVGPFLPAVKSQVAIHITKPVKVQPNNKNALASIDRSTERVIIPSIQLEKPFYEGTDPETTYTGIWHLPTSSSPDKGGNTVMVGHRWSYKKPSSAVLYDLHKVKQGDDIIVVHDRDIYHYRVTNIETVRPNQTSIEANTTKPIFTLYTCTPLWSVSHRLVVQSDLVEVL